MTAKTEIVKSKMVRVYDQDEYEKLIKGIRVAACMVTESHQIVDEASVLKRLNTLTINGAKDGNCCSCCGVGPFTSRAQQTAHYKHHWHTHNLKRKLFGKAPLTLGQFSARDDDSSVSGSDSETEGPSTNPVSDLFQAATRHCKAFFTNTKGKVFCVYRCILHHKKEELSTDSEDTWVERCERLTITGYKRWAVLMVSGGHFSGAIFAGGTPVVHKTFHSYVTRRGQGQAQMNRDQRGNRAPRSSGASLRRYNQEQFLKHVQEIISAWIEDLRGCYLVFYRAVGSYNQSALFGKDSPLTRDDPRLRVLPFPTRRPSFKEVIRVHETVASVEVYDTMELFQKALIASTSKTSLKSGSEANNKKTQKSPSKPIDRAKSRERAPRELPTQIVSSEDDGPCFIDSETPVGWIKTLSEQSSNGVITDSRKDLINDCAIDNASDKDSEQENVTERKDSVKVVKETVKVDEKQVKKAPTKIPANIKKMWKIISGKDQNSLETILEGFVAVELEAACNTQDPADGNTALHKAAIAAKPEMVTEILTAGGDPCIRNNALQTPYAATPHSDTRIAFRMFQAQFPDKYNYNKSQIPGPVTQEQLEQEKEKKAQQKKAKRLRDKEKQAKKNQIEKFLELTDVQKVRADLMMCFICGSKLPRPPFEYSNYTFCSIKCLQNHRNVRPLHKIK